MNQARFQNIIWREAPKKDFVLKPVILYCRRRQKMMDYLQIPLIKVLLFNFATRN